MIDDPVEVERMGAKEEYDKAYAKGRKDADWARRDINPLNELLGSNYQPPKGQEDAYRRGWQDEKKGKK